jgi:ATP-dependent DNA ligase
VKALLDIYPNRRPNIPSSDQYIRLTQLASEAVGQVKFVEWTPDGHLRHASFVALSEDRDARDVRRED